MDLLCDLSEKFLTILTVIWIYILVLFRSVLTNNILLCGFAWFNLRRHVVFSIKQCDVDIFLPIYQLNNPHEISQQECTLLFSYDKKLPNVN